MNKKGIELSLNFLIILFISIIILVGGITFTMKVMDWTSEREAELDERTLTQIRSVLEDGQQVAVPIYQVTIPLGKTESFGLGIFNSISTKNFRVAIAFKQAYDEFGKKMSVADGNGPEPDQTFIHNSWIFGREDMKYEINYNDYKAVPILVNVESDMDTNINTRQGSYEFNICVCECIATEGCDATTPTYCLDVCTQCTADYTTCQTDKLYSGHMVKVEVVVPN